jgi:hypothetical protein
MTTKSPKHLLFAALLAAFSVPALAVSVTFTLDTPADDGSPLRFDPAAIVFGDTGFTLSEGFGLSDFTAVSFEGVVAVEDTLSFSVTAPDGWLITSVSYSESGTGSVSGAAIARAKARMVIDGTLQDLGSQTFVFGSSGEWVLPEVETSFAIASLQSVDIDIINELLAAALGPGATASIAKTSASFSVTLAPVPLPPALGMLGVGLLALATVNRRKRS